MTAVQTFAALITHPRRAFTELEKSPRFAAPMWLLVVATIGMIIWFYSSVDVNWLINQALAGRQLSEAQRANAAALLNRGTLLGSALVGGVLVLFVTQVVQAFYFYFIYEFLDVQLTFRKWFALSWWCNLPQLISVLATALVLLLSVHLPTPTAVLSPLSLNALFFHFDPGDSGYSLLTSISLVQLLTILLMVIGVQTWSKRSWLLSAVIVLAPRLVIYGAWAWFTLR